MGALQRVCHRQRRNGAVPVVERPDHPIEDVVAYERAGGVVDQHVRGCHVNEAFETIQHRLLARGATRYRRQQGQIADGLPVALRVVRVHDHAHGADARMREKRHDRAPQQRRSRQQPVLLRHARAKAAAATAGNHESNTRRHRSPLRSSVLALPPTVAG
jgi:hypothetical protein